MSAISGLGRAVHGWGAHKANRDSSSHPQSTSVTSPTLAGSITGNAGVLARATQATPLSPGKLKQIEQAVTDALQSAKPTDDLKQVLRNAIAQVLKKPSANETSGDEADTDADADGTHRTFDQTLAAYGISPQQFRAELVAAVQKGAGNSQPGVSSLPAGIVLDTAA